MAFIFHLLKVPYSTHQLSVSPWEFIIKTQPSPLPLHCLCATNPLPGLSLSISYLLVGLVPVTLLYGEKTYVPEFPFLKG